MTANRKNGFFCPAGYLFILALAFACFLLTAVRASAAGATLVQDDAGLFSESEIRQMRDIAQELVEEYDINVLLLTTERSYGYTSAAYAENFYEDGGYAGNGANGGLILVIDLGNREMNLVTDGVVMRFITDSREERIYDKGYVYASEGNYSLAMLAMLIEAGKCMEQGIPGGQYLYDRETGRISRYRSLTVVEIVIAAGIALAAALAAASFVKRGYTKVKPYEYALGQDADFRITGQQDNLVNQFVTHRRLPRANISTGGGRGSGGGGNRTTTHTSSGGRTYGGGHGRRF